MQLVDVGGRLDGALEYHAGLFDVETARRMLGHYGVLLKGVAADPGVRISRLPF